MKKGRQVAEVSIVQLRTNSHSLREATLDAAPFRCQNRLNLANPAEYQEFNLACRLPYMAHDGFPRNH